MSMSIYVYIWEGGNIDWCAPSKKGTRYQASILPAFSVSLLRYNANIRTAQRTALHSRICSTKETIRKVNRGGMVMVNNMAFELFYQR